MKLTLRQWNKLAELAMKDYQRRKHELQSEMERLGATYADENEYLKAINKQKHEAFDLWQALTTQEL